MEDIKTISVLCPTRERPDLFTRMARSARDKAVTDGVQIFAYVDDDDPTADQYEEQWGTPLAPSHVFGGSVRIIRGPSDGVGKAWNRLAAKAEGDLLMMANDDLVFQTPGWDAAIVAKIKERADVRADKIFVAWANDGAPRPETRCTFPIVHRRWTEVLGYFAPECFHFLWHDTWVGDLGERIGRMIFISDVVVEHRHFSFKKAKYDQTYRRHRVGKDNTRKRLEDKAMFSEMAGVRQREARMLIEATKGGDREARE